MTTVQTTVSISISPEGMSLEAMEAAIGTALQQAGRLLLAEACGVMEREWLEQQGAALRRSKLRPLHLLTRFGWMRLVRWQMVQADGAYGCPLDGVLGLEPRQHASPWITEQAVALATRLPYRQATRLLSGLIEAPLDHRSLYRWVQRVGAAVVAEEEQQQEAVFAHGEIPARAPGQREIVLAEVDGTYLRAQREAVPDFEVRLGVLTSGRALESRTAKHRRYRLQERVRYGGVESARDFGERLFLAGEAQLGLSQAQHLLLVGDGADWIEALAGHDRWRATYQLDWWHLIRAFHHTFPEHPRLVQRLKSALYTGKGQQILRWVQLAQINGVGRPERVAALFGYLRANQDGFYGSHRLRPQLSDRAKLVCVQGSGAVEKHIDLTICRRFKGQGMRWSRAGANRLLKLRLRELDQAA